MAEMARRSWGDTQTRGPAGAAARLPENGSGDLPDSSGQDLVSSPTSASPEGTAVGIPH